MNVYVIDDIKIEIGAQLIAVYTDGKAITPQKIRKSRWFQSAKHLVDRFWNNSYFRRHTKAQVTIKTVEVVSRCIGYHSMYLLAREYLWPHMPVIIAFLKTIEWWKLFFCIDVGFAAGIFTTFLLVHVKRKVGEILTNRRGSVTYD